MRKRLRKKRVLQNYVSAEILGAHMRGEKVGHKRARRRVWNGNSWAYRKWVGQLLQALGVTTG